MATKTKSLMPRWIANIFTALAHLTNAFKTGAEMIDDSTTACKQLASLSLGAKVSELAKELGENNTTDEETTE